MPNIHEKSINQTCNKPSKQEHGQQLLKDTGASRPLITILSIIANPVT